MGKCLGWSPWQTRPPRMAPQAGPDLVTPGEEVGCESPLLGRGKDPVGPQRVDCNRSEAS